MTAPSPAARAAVAVALLVVVVGVIATALHLNRLGAEAERATARGVEARAATLAAALATGEGDLDARFDRLASLDWPAGLALLDADGTVLASSDAALSGASPWPRLIERPGVMVSSREGTRFASSASSIGESGRYLGVARRIAEPEGLWTALAVSLVLTLLVLGAVSGMAWYAGPRATAVLSVTAERMAANRTGDPRTQVEAAERVLGVLASPLRPLATRLLTSRSELSDASRQVAALLQINPHYVLIATFDGELIEANPAFYAATGLAPQAFRGSPISTLRETFPLEPLMEWADRSDREGASIQGIEYALVDADGHTLPVLVSLRAVRVRQRKAFLIQATDVAKEKRLERQVAAFSDTLELMVDQRVASLTAGKSTLRHLLDRAGVVLASFDGSGGTVRWNAAAEELTGRQKSAASHFHTAIGTLGFSEMERDAFASWFWSDVATPFVADSAFVLPDGTLRTHRMVWRTVANPLPGSSDRRTLIGIEVPESLPVGAFVPDGSIPIPEIPREETPHETGLPSFDAYAEAAPSAEAIAEEEA
ncbi:MAG: PAS domain-containing protein, partial [Bacteroidota bacterium]